MAPPALGGISCKRVTDSCLEILGDISNGTVFNCAAAAPVPTPLLVPREVAGGNALAC